MDNKTTDAAFEEKGWDDIEAIVKDAIDDAVSFVDSEISPDRIRAQKYYDGKVDLGHEEGRSKIVATKVRDTIRSVKPSIMRVFLSTTNAVEFIPRSEQTAQMAMQATEFINYQFTRHDGYKILSDAAHDAMVKKQGVVKAYWREQDEAKFYSFTDLSDEELELLLSDDNIEVVEQETEMTVTLDQMGVEVELPIHAVTVKRIETKGDLCIESVPPEEFFIDGGAKSFDDFYVCLHRTDLRLADLLAMGFEWDDIKGLGTNDGDMSDEEEYQRQGYSDTDDDGSYNDPSMRRVTVTEAYMRMDIDGTGVPCLYKFICAGEKNTLLDYEPCDELPFAKFEVDPEPHSFYGKSLAEIIIDDQDVSTSILRGILDNVALTNNPGMEMVDGMVNAEDLLNNEIGRIVRVKQPGMIRETAVPFIAGTTMPMLEYMNNQVEAKTGILAASGGMSADALQNNTATGVNAAVQAAAGQVEVMVRNLAHGLRDLFGLMNRIYRKNVDEEQIMRLRGEFIPVDPRAWDADMDTNINVGLGTGREAEKAAAYREILGLQMQVFQSQGPMNGVVSMENIRNTLSDMLASAGIRNSERYFGQMNAQTEQAMAQKLARQAQSAQGQDPTGGLVQVEMLKAQSKAQADSQKMEIERGKLALDAKKIVLDDDLERDKMAKDIAVKDAELKSKTGLELNKAALAAEMKRPRNYNNGF